MRPHLSRAGFTVIELVVTVLIIGFAIVPMMEATERALRDARAARDISVATFLAIREIENVRQQALCKSNATPLSCAGAASGWGVDYDDLATPPTDVDYAEIPNFKKYITDSFNASDNPRDPNGSRLKNIRVQVFRDSNASETLDPDDEAVTLETKIARRWGWF